MALKYTNKFSAEYADSISELYQKTGLGKRTPEKIINAFQNSFYAIICFDSDALVGAGRSLSDGTFYASIFDLAVEPDYQGHGIGEEIMRQLLEATPTANVHLTSTFGNEPFYNKLGFKKHKTAMAKYTDKNSPYLEHSISND